MVEGNHKTCSGLHTLHLTDVLSPYFRYPTLGYRMLVFALPEHFTTDYFHVYRDYAYLRVIQPPGDPMSQTLMRLSEIRTKLVRWSFLLIGPSVCLLAWLVIRRNRWIWARVYIFLILLIFSQIAISLLGEGIRDLSKHLLVAQYALDMLIALVLIHAVTALRWRTTASIPAWVTARGGRMTRRHSIDGHPVERRQLDGKGASSCSNRAGSP